MNAGRSMGHLIREAISNSFDQADVSRVEVTIGPGYARIEDDSTSGIPNPDLISVIFLTDKEESHLKRGRKGRGLKELISVADKASVDSIGVCVHFGPDGRKEVPSVRTKGTMVSIHTSVDEWQRVDEAVEYLRLIIPPKELIINGIPVQKPKLVERFNATLLTTKIINGIQKEFSAETDVQVYEGNGNGGWIYEMGIPIQKMSCPYLIDVQQRVPMNDNRDVVDQNYLRDVVGKAINILMDKLTKDDLKSDWVTECSGSISVHASLKYATKFLGEKTLLKSESKRANDMARERGYKLVDVDLMPSNVKRMLYWAKTAESFAKEILEVEEEVLIEHPTEQMQRFASFVEWMGNKVLGVSLTCKFMEKVADHTGHMSQANFNKVNGIIQYNVLAKENNFDKPLAAEMLSVLIHEFAHQYVSEHTREFTEAVEHVAGKVCFVLLHHQHEIMEKFGQVSYMSGKTTFITCACGATREVKTQDCFQVKRCHKCQREYQSKRRRDRREYLRSL
jgi:hypothetical protein